MAFLLGVSAGYVITGVALLWAMGIGVFIGFLVACLLHAGHSDRCADEGCVRRIA